MTSVESSITQIMSDRGLISCLEKPNYEGQIGFKYRIAELLIKKALDSKYNVVLNINYIPDSYKKLEIDFNEEGKLLYDWGQIEQGTISRAFLHHYIHYSHCKKGNFFGPVFDRLVFCYKAIRDGYLDIPLVRDDLISA